MRVRIAHLGVLNLLFLGISGVCSASFIDLPYSDTITFSRSSRDAGPSKHAHESQVPRTPFAPGTHNLSIGVGQVFLTGTLNTQAFENTIAPELNYTYGVSDLFAFQSNFSYHSHTGTPGSVSIWNLDAGLRANLAYFDQLVPFADVGLGFYSPTYNFTATNASVNSLLFGLQLGTGIDLMISNQVFFGAQLRYNSMFDSVKRDSLNTSRTLGGSYLSFMIHAGISF
jgi:hypothetical protein